MLFYRCHRVRGRWQLRLPRRHLRLWRYLLPERYGVLRWTMLSRRRVPQQRFLLSQPQVRMRVQLLRSVHHMLQRPVLCWKMPERNMLSVEPGLRQYLLPTGKRLQQRQVQRLSPGTKSLSVVHI